MKSYAGNDIMWNKSYIVDGLTRKYDVTMPKKERHHKRQVRWISFHFFSSILHNGLFMPAVEHGNISKQYLDICLFLIVLSSLFKLQCEEAYVSVIWFRVASEATLVTLDAKIGPFID